MIQVVIDTDYISFLQFLYNFSYSLYIANQMQAYGCAGRAGDAVLAAMKSNFSEYFSVQDQAWIGSIGRGMAATWRGGRGGMDQEGGEK